MFKVNKKDIRNDVFNVNFEHILHLVLVCLLLTLNKRLPAGNSFLELIDLQRHFVYL